MHRHQHSSGRRACLSAAGLALCAPVLAIAQQLPGSAQVKADVTSAVKNGKLTSIELDGAWKMERERGYNFSNVAKQAVIATKKNADGSEQRFNGFAIYKRGAASDAWVFDRLFSFGFETVGGTSATPDDAALHAITLKAMRERPAGFMPVDLRQVYRVDAFKVVPGSAKRRGDNEVTWEIIGEYVVDDTQSSRDPGVKKLREHIKVEGIQHLQTKAWIVSKSGIVRTESLQRQSLTAQQMQSLPTLAQAPFDQLYFGDQPAR